MNPGLPLATINLNIGRGNDNPRLVIMPGDDVQQLVTDVVKQYSLPQQAYHVIMQRVSQDLPVAMQHSPHKQTTNAVKETPQTQTPQHRCRVSLKENTPNNSSKQQ